MAKTLHPVAGAVALLTILTFWLATVLSTLLAGPETVLAVKTLIPWGFCILIPALAATGAAGLGLARRRPSALAARKRRRMALVAANGALILVPCALYLSMKAQAGALDGAFHAVQALELGAGAANLAMLGLNLRDGLKMARGPRARPAAA